jgi:hypothetical protein
MNNHRIFILGSVFLAMLLPAVVGGAPLTLSGTISYNGPYNGDSLFVAVIDTATGGDLGFVAVLGFDIGNSPVSQPYAFNLDSSAAPPTVWIAALLDVDGGGLDKKAGPADVLGWYGSAPIPTDVSTAGSQSGLDVTLPTGEIHGTVSFVPGQTGAEIFVSPQPFCMTQVKLTHPPVEVGAPGPYAVIGVYAGSYCLTALGYGVGPGPLVVCYGDYTCSSPHSVAVGEGEVVNGVDISFADPTPVDRTTWGRLKARYP